MTHYSFTKACTEVPRPLCYTLCSKAKFINGTVYRLSRMIPWSVSSGHGGPIEMIGYKICSLDQG